MALGTEFERKREEIIVFCSHCGKSVAEGASFCFYCGRPVVVRAQVLRPVVPARAEYYDAYSKYNYPYPYNYDYDYDYSCSEIPPFRSFLGLNIILSIFFCLPIGLFGVFHSVKALKFYRMALYEFAWLQSQIAQTIFWVGLIIGSLNILYQLGMICQNFPVFLEFMQSTL